MVNKKNTRKIKKIGNIRPNGKSQSGNVYDEKGISPSLCCTDYKNPIKIIEKNFVQIDDNRYMTTDKEKKNAYAITTRQRGRPLHKKQDNYVLEECIGSTQKHAARTNGTYSPTLTEAMGKGGGHVPMLKLRETTKKGYKEAHEGDGVLTNRGNRKIAKGIVREQHCGNLMTTPDWGTVTSDYRIRKLTPRECERLQAFYPTTTEVELWLSDQVKRNVQSVAELWHKNLKLVGNVEKNKLLKNVPSAEKNLQVKNQQTKKLVPESVHISYGERQIRLLCQEKSKSSAKTVEKKNMFHLQTVTENFVHLIVGMSTILERIIQAGKEELLQNGQWQIHQENGKIVAKLFGKEIMPLANSVEEDLTTMKSLMKFITSDLSNIKSQDTMLITLYCCVIGVIIGYIPVKIDLSCLEKIDLAITTDWTAYGKDGEEISNTQRYKCCGNAVTTTVVTFMINQMFGDLIEDKEID